MKISIIQPSRNNLKYLKWSYEAIRKNQGEHTVEVCIADDASTDGTWAWCVEMEKKDPHFKWIRNMGPERLGHTILYDRLVNEVASHDVCMIYHADMYLCPGALDAIENHIGAKKIISLTRIEPPLHPPGPEKILLDCGIEPEQFDEDKLLHHLEMEYDILHEGRTTEGIFAPWAFMKSDFQEIGGHDPLYAPQSKEDSDIFNRFQLNGVQFIQTWEGFVYHMTCRGSRFNPSLTTPGQNSPEWEAQNQRSTRNFIRKWGHFVKHDTFMKPIIPPKYNIAFVAKNCTDGLLHALEPWCDRIYVDGLSQSVIDSYIEMEQPNTKYNLAKRIFNTENNYPEGENDIVVVFDATRINQHNFQYIQQLPEIIKDSGEVGEFELDIFTLIINNITELQNNLIVCSSTC
jgi:glycosyltransferase involved in cell wall biosynthesis